MGGVFSGQRMSKKRLVESCNAIDTADLNRWQLLRAGNRKTGSLEWRRGDGKEPSASVGYTLAIEYGVGTLRLQYQVGQPPECFDYPVQLVTTPCHLGGVRWWFTCPVSVRGARCGRRVRKLYLRGRFFACRHCHALAYRSSQQSDGRVYAALRGGLDLARFDRVEGMSASQLGFALKVLTFEKKRIDRLGRRPDRTGRRRAGEDGDAG